MTNRIRNQGRIAPEWRRLVTAEVSAARDQVRSSEDSAVDRSAGVHEARKHIRRARSLLRLVRPQIGGKAYARHNGSLREAARTLSPLRDADVMVATLDDLPATKASKTLRGQVMADRRRRRSALFERREVLEAVDRRLDEVLTASDGVELRSTDWDAVEDGLDRTYRRAYEAFQAMNDAGSDDHRHKARKRAKDLRYQLQTLSSIAPTHVKPMVKQAHALTDALGDERDLMLVVSRLETAQIDDADELRVEIATRREALRREAATIGEQLYAERPKAFVRRMAAYWDAWRRREPVIPAELHPENASADELMKLARKLEIPGRSTMRKRELAEALAKETATTSAH